MNPGDCYWGRLSGVRESHLFIQVSAVSQSREVLLVNVSTCRPLCDRSCVLKSGDHPRIVHDSFVFYEKAIVITTAQIDRLLQGELWQQVEPLHPAVLARVVQGGSISQDMPRGRLTFLQANLDKP